MTGPSSISACLLAEASVNFVWAGLCLLISAAQGPFSFVRTLKTGSYVRGASARIARSVARVRQGVIWHYARCGQFLILHCSTDRPGAEWPRRARRAPFDGPGRGALLIRAAERHHGESRATERVSVMCGVCVRARVRAYRASHGFLHAHCSERFYPLKQTVREHRLALAHTDRQRRAAKPGKGVLKHLHELSEGPP